MMLFRVIKRAPWIALGAAGAYYLDPNEGPTRRAALVGKLDELKSQWMGSTPTFGRAGDDAPLTPSVDTGTVAGRRSGPLAEETAAGVPSPAPGAMAEQILADSEQRVTDRAGSARERRTSEETVAPERSVVGGRLPGEIRG